VRVVARVARVARVMIVMVHHERGEAGRAGALPASPTHVGRLEASSTRTFGSSDQLSEDLMVGRIMPVSSTTAALVVCASFLGAKIPMIFVVALDFSASGHARVHSSVTRSAVEK